MAKLYASTEARIAASADQVYQYIADYRWHHARFLPPAFADMQVQLGGYGAGTVVTFQLTVAGRTRTVHGEVAEPVPGRVLTETDMQTGAVTTFTVTPDGAGSRVRIATEWRPASSFSGLVEWLAGPVVLRRLYREELRRLNQYASDRAASVATTPVQGLVR